jgi:hypothetical protein
MMLVDAGGRSRAAAPVERTQVASRFVQSPLIRVIAADLELKIGGRRRPDG